MAVPAPSPDARRRSDRSHAAVLAAATRLVDRSGYGGTTIEDIAAAAGVGKQTIYRWWPNKAALFIEVYQRLVSPAAVTVDTGTLAGDFGAMLNQLSRFYIDTPAGKILAGLIAEAQTAASLADQLREAYVAPRRAIVGSILERATARKEIPKPGNSDFISDMFSAAVWFQLLLGTPQLDRRFKRELTGVLVRAVGSMDTSSASPKPRTRRADAVGRR
jgi:AcrR family transcriptional regulator